MTRRFEAFNEKADPMEMNDERCCGSGTCIINAEGFCWCGQRWDGQTMCFPDRDAATGPAATGDETPAPSDKAD